MSKVLKLTRYLAQEELKQERLDDYDEETSEVLARHKSGALDNDGMVILPAIEGFQAGDFLEVKITDADEHDLYAKPIHPDDNW